MSRIFGSSKSWSRVWWFVFLSGMTPLAFYGFQIFQVVMGASHQLGADPGKKLVQVLGTWGLVYLLASLAVTPLRRLTGFSQLARLRRMFGLLSFGYLSLHFFLYVLFLLEWDLNLLSGELKERPYVTVGFIAYLLLLPMAVTSTNTMMKRLGLYWARLHKLVYPATVLALVHLIWLTRADYTKAFIFSVLVVFLLGYRFYKRYVIRRSLSGFWQMLSGWRRI